MNETMYTFQKYFDTTFCRSEKKAWLARIGGLSCGLQGRDEGPTSARGLITIRTDKCRYEADDLHLEDFQTFQNELRAVWKTHDQKINVESSWSFDSETGIANRKDKIANIDDKPLTIHQCLSRFVFSPGFYEFYSQDSRWCYENQGIWQDLSHGRIVLRSEQARSCLGGTPYMFLRDKELNRSLAFHLIPLGNWTIRITAQSDGSDLQSFAVVELGTEIENLSFMLSPGESLNLPEVLIQTVPENEPHRAAPRLHRYLLKQQSPKNKPFAPVIYNTWFDEFELLHPTRLRKQLAAAKEIGCEVFVIDAGWYGQGADNWNEQTGDWREKLNGAFEGKMADFAGEVRASGLGFGLWMEPERIGKITPAIREHPEWFISGAMGAYPNLTDPIVYDYIQDQISSLIERYQLVWLKIDFNNRLGIDPSGNEFYRYYRAWYSLMDELREKHPKVFFENCGSGGMRLDLNILNYFDGHFLSDSANPVDVLRISQGAMLRLLPGRISRWATLRSVGRSIPHYGQPADKSDERFAVPDGPVWDTPVIMDIKFILHTMMTGMLGFSGDIISLSDEAKQIAAKQVAWYKKWREHLASSIGHLLTQPKLRSDRDGWTAFQFQSPKNTTSLLFVFRMNDTRWEQRFYPRGLDDNAVYVVRNLDNEESIKLTGLQIKNQGISISLSPKIPGLPATHRSTIVEIIPEK